MRAGKRKPQNVSVISNRSPRPQARQLWLVCYNTPAPPGESLKPGAEIPGILGFN